MRRADIRPTFRGALRMATLVAVWCVCASSGAGGEWQQHLTCHTPSCVLVSGPFVWVGTRDCGLFRYEPGSDEVLHYTNLNSQLPGNVVSDLASGSDGAVLAGTDAGLVSISRAGEWRVWDRADAGWPVEGVVAVCIDAQGRPWVGLEGGGVFGYDGGAWVDVLETNPGFPIEAACSPVKEMEWGEDGALWLMLERLIVRFDEGTWEWFRFLHTRGFALGASDRAWTCAQYEVPYTRMDCGVFVLGGAGRELYSGLDERTLGGCGGGVFGGGNAPIWVAGGDGLFLLDGPGIVRFDYPDAEGAQAVFAAGHDRRIWAARRMDEQSSLHPGDLVLWSHRENRWTDHRFVESLPVRRYDNVAVDGRDVVWVVQSSWLHALREGSWQAPDTPRVEYQTLRLSALKSDGKGRVYGLGWTYGSTFSGAAVVRQISPGTSEWSFEMVGREKVRDAVIDKSGRIWVAGDGFVRMKGADGWESVQLPGDGSSSFSQVEAGAHGAVWLVPDDPGLMRWTPSGGVVHLLPRSWGFSTDRVEKVVAGAEGCAYLAIEGGRLAKVEGDEGHIIPVSFPGIDSAKATPLLVDREGRLWCSVARLCLRCRSDGFLSTVTHVTEWIPAGLGVYDGTQWQLLDARSSGLPSNAVSGVYEGAEGVLWVATDIGLARFVPGNTLAAERNGRAPREGRQRGRRLRHRTCHLYDLRGRLLDYSFVSGSSRASSRGRGLVVVEQRSKVTRGRLLLRR